MNSNVFLEKLSQYMIPSSIVYPKGVPTIKAMFIATWNEEITEENSNFKKYCVLANATLSALLINKNYYINGYYGGKNLCFRIKELLQLERKDKTITW